MVGMIGAIVSAFASSVGVLGATITTWVTFTPCFFFIFLGAPLIESTHGNLHFTAPLAGITAAVVGVIVNLAVFFAYHVLWPRGPAGPFDAASAAIGLAAAVALFRFKAGVIKVVLAAGVAGLAIQLTRAALAINP